MGMRLQEYCAARRSLADIIVGLAGKMKMQASHIPDAEALSGGALQIDDQGRGAHAGVAPAAGDLTRNTRPHRAIEIIDGIVKFSTRPRIDPRAHIPEPALGKPA